jgi:RNA polymerase sigma-70 factor (ECF subfamily)
MKGPEGDISKIELLFKEHHAFLCNVAYNIVLDSDAAKDIVQEVFMKLWEKKENIEFGPAIKSYLFKATTHHALNYIENFKKTGKWKEALLKNISESSARDATDLEVQELENRVRLAIEKLPPKCKMIYLMSRQEGLKYAQIADTMNLSVKTVENQMGIALEKLRTELKPYLTREFLITWTILFLCYLLIMSIL